MEDDLLELACEKFRASQHARYDAGDIHEWPGPPWKDCAEEERERVRELLRPVVEVMEARFDEWVARYHASEPGVEQAVQRKLVEEEREECAKIADGFAEAHVGGVGPPVYLALAAEIRARK